MTTTFSPGSLVRARGREWMVLGGSTEHVLRVRPLTGSEEDQTVLHMGLEAEPQARPRRLALRVEGPGGAPARLPLGGRFLPGDVPWLAELLKAWLSGP